MTKEEMLRLLTAAYTGPGSAAEGTFAGDVLRACADGGRRSAPDMAMTGEVKIFAGRVGAAVRGKVRS